MSRAALLGPSDPPPFELINPNGKLAALLLCDHASRAAPAALDGLGLEDAVLRRHIGWDIGAAEVTRLLSVALDAPAILGGYSRLVIDLNRTLDDPTSISVISDGVVVPGNQDLTPEQAESRANEIFHRYHDAVVAAIDGLRSTTPAPAILSIHSYTPVMRGVERPWHVGVLWDRDGRLARPLIDALGAHAGLCIGDNQPYSGRDQFGYTIETHALPAGLPNVLIEVRQDLIDTHHGVEHWAGILAPSLADILADLQQQGMEPT